MTDLVNTNEGNPNASLQIVLCAIKDQPDLYFIRENAVHSPT